MDDSFLSTLRCPIDPKREATLTRDDQELICSGCSVRFPIRQGIPILLATEVNLPEGCKDVEHLPCQRGYRRR